ncbi:MAG: hypothetical protein RI926_1199 [Actinomycetota bacterium]|jgi:hypothetical protein
MVSIGKIEAKFCDLRVTFEASILLVWRLRSLWCLVRGVDFEQHLSELVGGSNHRLMTGR